MMADENRIPITKEGLENLQKEYQKLTEVRRPQIVERMASARTQGDLAENSEYTSAKEELAFIDGRITELKDVLSRAKVIEVDYEDCSEVKLGCLVGVQTESGDQTFHLVGEWEADPAEAKISYQSPLGQSLLGKKLGETVEFEAPAGKIVYTITKIN